jgi:hypothetical protein
LGSGKSSAVRRLFPAQGWAFHTRTPFLPGTYESPWHFLPHLTTLFWEQAILIVRMAQFVLYHGTVQVARLCRIKMNEPCHARLITPFFHGLMSASLCSNGRPMKCRATSRGRGGGLETSCFCFCLTLGPEELRIRWGWRLQNRSDNAPTYHPRPKLFSADRR